MMECMRLIIGEVGTREREGGGLKIGRSGRSRTFFKRIFRGEGATANFRVILN